MYPAMILGMGACAVGVYQALLLHREGPGDKLLQRRLSHGPGQAGAVHVHIYWTGNRHAALLQNTHTSVFALISASKH